MEPLSTALTFATIVGLMSDFASSRAREDSIQIGDFIEWLRFHGHNELRQLIEGNTAATVSVKAALAEGTDKILMQLAEMERLLGALTSEKSTMRDLALNFAPEASFSAQSQEILIAFEVHVAGKALLHSTLDDASLVFVDGKKNGGYEPTDPRFLDADLGELVRNGFLDYAYSSRGEKLYQITRKGSSVGQALIKRQVAV